MTVYKRQQVAEIGWSVQILIKPSMQSLMIWISTVSWGNKSDGDRWNEISEQFFLNLCSITQNHKKLNLSQSYSTWASLYPTPALSFFGGCWHHILYLNFVSLPLCRWKLYVNRRISPSPHRGVVHGVRRPVLKVSGDPFSYMTVFVQSLLCARQF